MAYDHNEAQIMTGSISDAVIKWLTNANKNFKFIVNTLIMQKAEFGINISGSCFWDNDTDGSLTVKHETDNLIVIVNVFACAL
jgi:dynein light chain Tctex-type 1